MREVIVALAGALTAIIGRSITKHSAPMLFAHFISDAAPR
jgi:hypothetical protein